MASEARFVHQSLDQVAKAWDAVGIETLASLGVPDSVLGRRWALVRGDVNLLWSQWYVESILDPRRVPSMSYASLFATVRREIDRRFSAHDKTDPERHELAVATARFLHAVGRSAQSDRQRLSVTKDVRQQLVDETGWPVRCWICGADFSEQTVEVFVSRRSRPMKLPQFIDVLRPRGLNEQDLRIEVDHVVPFAHGGEEDSNLRLACGWCNRHKGARLSLYDTAGRPRLAGPNDLNLHSLPQPFWLIRLFGVVGRCEHPGGCPRNANDTELLVAMTNDTGAMNPSNLRVTCRDHDPMLGQRLQPPSVIRRIWRT